MAFRLFHCTQGHPSQIQPHTKDGASPKCVTAKAEDVRVVSRHHAECVVFVGQLRGSLDGLVKLHTLHKSLFGEAIMVCEIDLASCKEIGTQVQYMTSVNGFQRFDLFIKKLSATLVKILLIF